MWTFWNHYYSEFYQAKFVIEFAHGLLVFVFIPCCCALGLFFNNLIIWTVNKNKERELKDSFYQYMSLNVKFNYEYCFIFLFYPINSCADSLFGGYFCSTIRQFTITQLYKVLLVAFFSESIKMGANVFLVLIAVNRYMQKELKDKRHMQSQI
jgi:hypothetical protein